MAAASSIASRRSRAVESFGNAASAIGPVAPGMSLFAVTRGQWSMIDAILHTLDCVGPSKLSLWTWTVAEYEVQTLTRLRNDQRLTAGRLVIDAAPAQKIPTSSKSGRKPSGLALSATLRITPKSPASKARPAFACCCGVR